MPFKDPARKKAYLREYKKKNQAKLAAYDRNRGSWRYFRLREMAFRSNEKLLSRKFGHDESIGMSLITETQLDDPTFIVISPKGRRTTERLRE
jgi:hypothetical protein